MDASHWTRIHTDFTDSHGATWPRPNCFAWRFLGVLRDLAVKLKISIHRQDAKNAKKSAKQNFFQAAKDFRFGSTARPSRENPQNPYESVSHTGRANFLSPHWEE